MDGGPHIPSGPAQAIVGEFLKTFAEFPPRQKAASFGVDQVMEKAMEASSKLAAAAAGGGSR
jgi:arylsulfatase